MLSDQNRNKERVDMEMITMGTINRNKSIVIKWILEDLAWIKTNKVMTMAMVQKIKHHVSGELLVPK